MVHAAFCRARERLKLSCAGEDAHALAAFRERLDDLVVAGALHDICCRKVAQRRFGLV
jgi:hypothetical protein